MKFDYKKIAITFRDKFNILGYSNLSIIVIGLAVFITGLSSNLYREERVIQIDALAYYTYLPATFIYQDLKLGFFTEPGPHYEHVKGKAWISFGPEGQRILAVSYGMSLLYAPFFFIAHLISTVFDIDPYGFSWPYHLAVQVAAFFYLLLGLFFIRKTLLLYFDELVTAITILGVVIGTNLFYYSTFEAGMSHVFNFAMISLFIWLLQKWLNAPTLVASLILGLLTGLIILVRPSNILIIVLFLLWDIFSFKDMVARLRFIIKNIPKVMLMVLMSFLIWIPQFLYWKYIVGTYLYFSYGDGVTFFWDDPQIFNILFSYRKGWLLYTPMMLLSIIGLIFLKKYNRKSIIPVSLTLVIYIYVLSCWCFWWFGGGFGSRGFIDIYGLLSIPLAAIISFFFFNKRMILKISFFVIFLLLIVHNLFETAQYRNGAIHFANMTKEAYWKTFGKLKPEGNFYDLLKEPPYEEVKQRIQAERERSKNTN